MKKIFYIKIILFFLFNKVNAQYADILPNSPIAKDFGFHGKYPVDMFRGNPVISIPIFNTKIGTKNFDISLNYDAKTVKPENIPGWAGLGWNINLGGAITRIGNGEYDEFYSSMLTNPSYVSYLDNYNKLDNNDWNGSSLSNLFYETISGRPVLIPSPDEFIVNVMGQNGSFFFSEKGKWIGRTKEGRTFSVEHVYKYDFRLNNSIRSGSPYKLLKRILYGFNITMDDGTKYIFGQDNDAIEFGEYRPQCDNCHYNEQIISNSWLINEIIFPDGKNVKYTYERELRPNLVASIGETTLNIKKASGEPVENSYEGFNATNLIYNVYLKKIESDNFIIEINRSLANSLNYKIVDYDFNNWASYLGGLSFFSQNLWYKLDNISIKDKKNNIISSAQFSFNNDPTKRLRLENIEINSNEKYSFKYNSNFLPNYLARLADEWGYYNNAGINAPPNINYAKSEVLEQIIYPTGGSTYFEYELNDYSKYGDKVFNNPNLKLINVPSSTPAGGLRIKNIRNCSNAIANCEFKTYSYLGDDGNSSGILPYKFVYSINGSGSLFQYTKTSNNSFQSLKGEGNLVGYSKVTEESNGGKKEIYFTNFDNENCNDFSDAGLVNGQESQSLFRTLPYTSSSLMRGKPLKEIVYSNTKKIGTTDYKYSYLKNYIKAHAISHDKLSNLSSNLFVLAVNAHYINFNTSFLEQKTTTYEGVTTIDNYVYEYQNNNLTKQETIFPDNSIQTINYKYAEGGYLKDKNIVGIPLTQEITKNINGITKTISKTETKYPISIDDAKSRNTENKDLALPFDIYSLNLNSSAMTKDVIYDKYDGKGNLLQYTLHPDANGNGIPTVIIWGYNQTLPIAKVEGATYVQVTNLISSIVNASDSDASNPANEPTFITALDNFRNNASLSAYQITTYTYDPLIGVTSITPPSGIREVYIYDSANRLKEVRQDSATGKLLKTFKYNFKN